MSAKPATSSAPYPYFGGTKLGHVAPIAVRTFAEFAAHLKKYACTLAITRAEFQGLPKGKRSALKKTQYFTPCAFASAGERATPRATVCNLIAIDIDDPDDARSLLSRKTTIQEDLGLSFLVYTTASSTPDLPRLRFVASAKEIPLTKYPDAVRTLAGMLALTHVTPESFTPVQPMYFPTTFRGEKLP